MIRVIYRTHLVLSRGELLGMRLPFRFKVTMGIYD